MNILIAMSGGVDSGVAAGLLTADPENNCTGCTMRLHDQSDAVFACGSLRDIDDARAAAERLGIPHRICDFSDAFRAKVMEPFFDSYLRAETPNPCIECNRHMKVGGLLRLADELGCDHIATGHYARIEKTCDGYLLKKALYAEKDQSYVLYFFTQEQLARILFPLGELSKPQVRALAVTYGLENAAKPESQDICFVPDGDYAGLITRYTGQKGTQGDFIDLDGNIVGRHEGIMHYTIGQRRGLRLPMGERIYVCGLDPDANTVTIGPNEALFSTRVSVRDMHWISGYAPDKPFRCAVKLRYRQKEQPAWAAPLDDNGLLLTFDEPQRAATPGQSAVLYDGDIVLGGGIITR